MESDSEILAVTICATASYQYAMLPQARLVHANLRHLTTPIVIVLVGDSKMEKIGDFYAKLFGEKARVVTVKGFEEKKDNVPYKNGAQLLIAQMRTAAFTAARAEGATLCWSLDSDVLPKTSHCFRTLKWMIEMPGGFYQVAISPYPSQSGGDLLTGRGTPQNPISSDWGTEERDVPEDLRERMKTLELAAKTLKGEEAPPELQKEFQEVNEAVRACPPKGNIWELTSKYGWRRRGWMSAAYPALGRGVIVPTDWCGFGNTLMNRLALDEVDFSGYDGGGTEDLYAVWHRWNQVGIRIGSALHEPSGHVSRRPDGAKFLTQVRFVVDQDEDKGECVGHLRPNNRPFYDMQPGEAYNAANDGNPLTPKQRQELQAKAKEERAKAAEKIAQPSVGGRPDTEPAPGQDGARAGV